MKKMNSLIFIFIVFIGTERCFSSKCPPQEKMSPCSCSDELSEVECRNLTSVDQLSKPMMNLNDTEYQRFLLYHSKMRYISKWVFRNVSFKSVAIEDAHFERLFEEIPQHPVVEELQIHKVTLEEDWDWRPIRTFTALKSIHLQEIHLGSLDYFKQLSKALQYIHLDKCNVVSIDDDQFQKFSDLKGIAITHDTITEIKRSMFQRPSNLESLNFSFNRIATVPRDFFDDMPFLFLVILDNNQVQHLPSFIARDLPFRSGALMLKENPLVCDCKMKWILEIERDVLFGTCSYPIISEGIELKDLRAENFGCCPS